MRCYFLLPLIFVAGCACTCFSVKDDKPDSVAYGAYAIEIKECPSTIQPIALYEKIAKRLGSKLHRPEQGHDVTDDGMIVVQVDIVITETEQKREWSYWSAIGLCYAWPLLEVTDSEFNVKIACGDRKESVNSRVRKTMSFCMQPMGYLPMLCTDTSIVGKNVDWDDDTATGELVLDAIAARIESKLTKEFYSQVSMK